MIKKLVKVYCHFSLIFFLTLFSGQCIAQLIPADYILTDTVFSQGKLVFSNDTVTFSKKKYTAADLSEFQKSGRRYVSLSHEGIPKFYEILIAGKTSLLTREKHFSINKGDTTNVLTKENLYNELKDFFQCEEGGDFLSFVTYNQASLINSVKRYNTKGCQDGYFPYKKIGVTAGFSRLTLKGYFNDKANDFKAHSSGAFVGVFGDFPVFVKDQLFVTIEAHYLFSKFSIYSENPNALYFTEGNVNAVTVPFGLKWLDVSKKVKKYIKAGSVLSVVNLKTDKLYTAWISDRDMITSVGELENPTSFGIGVQGAVGLEIPWQEMRNINLELRFYKSFSITESPLKQFSSISLALAVNL
jgi:hypothetical protein